MKLTTGFTMKVPAEEDFSSVGCGATIEADVPQDQAQDASSVQGWLRELFEQAKAAVQEQLRAVPRRNNGGQWRRRACGQGVALSYGGRWLEP
jgi:hypothetical protein